MRPVVLLITLFPAVLTLTAQDPSTSENAELKSAARLGAIYWPQGRYDEAEWFYQRVADLRARLNGRDSLEYAGALLNHAKVEERVGRDVDATRSYQEVLDLFEKLLTPGDLRVGLVAYDLGALYFSGGEITRAEPLLLRAASILQENSVLVDALSTLAELYARGRFWEKSREFQLKTLQVTERIFGAGSPEIGLCLCAFAKLDAAQGHVAETDRAYAQAVPMLEHVNASVRADTIPAPRGYVYRTFVWSGRPDDGQPSSDDRSRSVEGSIAGCLSEFAEWLRKTNRETLRRELLTRTRVP